MIAADRKQAALFRSAILVVDDAPTNRSIVGAQLRRFGFQDISFAEDGRQALERVAAHSPDLILLDLMMPVLDGFDTCRALRSDPRWEGLPVLAMTGLDEADERAKIFAAGATDLILKPIHSAELLARVTIHLQNRLLINSLREFNDRAGAELAAARQMQQSLLPDAALLARIEAGYGVSIASRFTPSTELAGDLWGVWPIDAQRFAVFAFDVVGHGTIAAINAFRIHTLLEQDRARQLEPAAFLAALNRRLCPLLATGQYATMVYAVCDPAADALHYAAAGYTSPVLGDARGNRLLDGSGLPLGILEAAQYETRHAPWARGQSVLFYSDALSEARDAAGAMLGEERVQSLCAEALQEGDAGRAVGRLAAAINGNAGPADDLTLICVMRDNR